MEDDMAASDERWRWIRIQVVGGLGYLAAVGVCYWLRGSASALWLVLAGVIGILGVVAVGTIRSRGPRNG
jgi:hypothetical protein